METLSVTAFNGGTRIFLGEKEITGVQSYEIKSSAGATAELSLKLTVTLNNLGLGQHGGNHLSGDLSKDTD